MTEDSIAKRMVLKEGEDIEEILRTANYSACPVTEEIRVRRWVVRALMAILQEESPAVPRHPLGGWVAASTGGGFVGVALYVCACLVLKKLGI